MINENNYLSFFRAKSTTFMLNIDGRARDKVVETICMAGLDKDEH